MKKSNSLIGMQEGYSRRSTDNSFNNNNNKNIKYKSEEYPTGIIPTITIAISLIIAIICVFVIKPINSNVSHKFYLQHEWNNLLFYVFGASMCLMGFWWIGRTGFLSYARFGMLKFSRTIKFNLLKQKIKYKVAHSAIDDVQTIDQWEEYLKRRKKKTKKIFIINLIVYSSLFVISLILMLSI